jgi:AP2-like factor, euAP2 lineage
MVMREIELTRGQKAIIDDDIFETYGHIKWYAAEHKGRFYARNSSLGKNGKRGIYLHNFVMGNPINKTWQVKFKNGNTLDCRKENLMFIRHSDNTQQNSKTQKLRMKTTSFLGVSHYNYYVAKITYEGKTMKLGRYETAEEAAKAYNQMALKLFGETAKLNELARS